MSHAGFRILVVEDELFSRNMVGRLLTGLGAEHVTFATSCAEARQAIASDTGLRMVVADHYLTDGTGIALLAETRQGRLALAHDTFFVIATASTSFALTAVALALDADSFMSKPFGRDELAKRFYDFLHGNRSIKSTDHYRAIDAEGMIRAAEMLDPLKAARQPPPLTPLTNVLPDSPLSADLVAADGHRLLPMGTKLTRHLIGRLTELGIVAVPVAPTSVSVKAAERRAKLRDRGDC
ncbi:MAG: response regulator [Magnetospirillum sp.]|nr:response regulator [Magnetospirillum sp.]